MGSNQSHEPKQGWRQNIFDTANPLVAGYPSISIANTTNSMYEFHHPQEGLDY
jgi:hypothetical protein